jgi:hypothetical protein
MTRYFGSWILGAAFLGAGLTTHAGPLAVSNLCYNGSFEVATNGLDGWITDYRWEGNSHYMANHERIEVIPTYKGKTKVMHLDGQGGGYTDTKAECQPIPYENGARYQCTLDLNSTTEPHVYFVGYKWKPGIRPYDDKPPHPGDLRRIYKSQFREHKITAGPNGWKKVTFEFPMENPSALAQQSLSELRFFTVIIMVVADYKGHAYVDDVRITKIKQAAVKR